VTSDDFLPQTDGPARARLSATPLRLFWASLLLCAGCGTQPDLGELITAQDQLPGATHSIAAGHVADTDDSGNADGANAEGSDQQPAPAESNPPPAPKPDTPQ